MPNQSSQPRLSEQIAAGTSLGEIFFQDQRTLYRAAIDQRITRLLDTAAAACVTVCTISKGLSNFLV